MKSGAVRRSVLEIWNRGVNVLEAGGWVGRDRWLGRAGSVLLERGRWVEKRGSVFRKKLSVGVVGPAVGVHGVGG